MKKIFKYKIPGLGFGVAFLATGFFIKITSELREKEFDLIDGQILEWVKSFRLPVFNQWAIEITSLGSGSVLFLVAGVGVLIAISFKNYLAVLYLILVTTGAGVMTILLKNLFERDRPNISSFLIDANGYSYPSGHSLGAAAVYFSVAIICVAHIKNVKARLALFISAGLLVGLVGLSRVYLGVHYFTDVLSGILLGIAWAFLLAASIKIIEEKAGQKN